MLDDQAGMSVRECTAWYAAALTPAAENLLVFAAGCCSDVSGSAA